MPEHMLSGTPASPGVAVGRAWRLPVAARTSATVPRERRESERAAALAGLAAAATELRRLAHGMEASAAEIVETGALMAEDPALIAAIEAAILDDGVGAPDAILSATAAYARMIASLDDPVLAARADDVHSLGRRAAALTNGRAPAVPSGSDLILIAEDLGPADVAELASALAGIVLEGGAPTAHAAIVARSLGVPMVTGMGSAARTIADGAQVVLDGSTGAVVLEPSREREDDASHMMRSRHLAARRAHELRREPAITTDGARITVLANVASPEELELAIRAGAEGVGLLRTELAFLEASEWPSEHEHAAAVRRIVAGLEDQPAVVRVLDFGADKSPPFLNGVAERGIELLLAHRDAFVSQLRALVLVAQAHDVRVLLPMVESVEQVTGTRDLLERVARRLGCDSIPVLGAMIETPAAAAHARAIAAQSDFLSIGTNDLTATTLGADRFTANAACAHDPRVLVSIARSVEAAHEAGIPIEVCGEAASDAIMLPLLVGLGIDELSVGAARVGAVREWIRRLNAAETAGLARSALTMDSAEEVEWAVRPMAVEHALAG